MMAAPEEKTLTIRINPRKIKRAAAIALVVVVAAAAVWLVATRAVAAIRTDAWDGETVDTSWYDASARKDAYTLRSAAQLAGLARLVNDGTDDFHDVVVSLGTNVNLDDHAWTPIGGDPSSSSVFRGSFDGRGNSIVNLNIMSDLDYQSLFGSVAGGTIKNLVVSGRCGGRDNAAGLACEASNENFENIVTDVDVVSRGYWNNASIAGMCGHYSVIADAVDGASYHITDCRNNGSVEARNWQVGGLIGQTVVTEGATLEMSGCENSGYVYVKAESDDPSESIAGLIADVAGPGTYVISDCSNTADVYASEVAGVGGLIGTIEGDNVTLSKCRNAGAVQTDAYNSLSVAAGIVAESRGAGYTMEDCVNEGTLSTFNGKTIDLGNKAGR